MIVEIDELKRVELILIDVVAAGGLDRSRRHQNEERTRTEIEIMNRDEI
jgi:hypothetical protein